MAKSKEVLRVSDSTLQFRGTFYQLSNITQYSKWETVPRRGGAIMWGCVCVLLVMLFAANNLPGGAMAALCGACLGFARAARMKPTFGLSLETNAGSSRLFTTKDEKLVDDIIATIERGVQKRLGQKGETFQIEALTVVGGDNIVGNSGGVANRSTNVRFP